MTALTVAFTATQLMARTATKPLGSVHPKLELAAFLLSLPLWIIIGQAYGLYDRDGVRAAHSTIDELPSIFHLVTVGSWLLFAGTWATGVSHPSLFKATMLWALSIVLIATLRGVARYVCRCSASYLQNTLVVGCGDLGRIIARKLTQHPEYGLNLVGFVEREPGDPEGANGGAEVAQFPIVGHFEELERLVALFDIERVVFSVYDSDEEARQETLATVRRLREARVHVDTVPHLFEIIGPGTEFHTIEALPLMGLRPLQLGRSAKILKRVLDVSGSGILLLLLSPVLAVIALAVKLDTPGSVFFRQARMGSGNRDFAIMKFRTMVTDAEQRKDELRTLNVHIVGGDDRLFKIEGDPRVTRVGRFLRRYMLDELPQLLNVLRGEMSLVGPRPLILDEDKHVHEWARKRLDLKPGMTGLWQVLGGSSRISFEEMVRLDVLYVSDWSLGHDLRLLLSTLPLVLRGGGGSY